jgi:amino acid transporter
MNEPVETATGADSALVEARKQVESHSAVFKKELGLFDLVLGQLLIMLGANWVGTAAKLGGASLIFWLLGIAIYYVPLAFVVTHLNRLMPLEGGIYQWAKLAFNELTGFMVAWNMWVFLVLLMSWTGLNVASILAFAAGQGGEWMASSKWFIGVATLASVGLLVIVARLGLGLGKKVQNAGGIILLVVFALFLILPLTNLTAGGTAQTPMQIAMPTLTLVNLTIFTKLVVFGLSGFEFVAIFAGESRNPGRAIGKSVIIAAPIIALMYILGTYSVLYFVRPEDADLIAPIPQSLGLGLRRFGIAAYVAPLAILLLLARDMAQVCFTFSGNARFPLVAGWDHIIPEWFTRLHPKYKTPVNSILFTGLLILCISLISLIGVDYQEAFQMLQGATGVFFGLGYLVMFAIPLFGLKGQGVVFPLWLKIGALSGLLMVLLFIALSIFPIIEVQNHFLYAAKIGSVVVFGNAIGIAIYLMRERKMRLR